MRLGDFRITPTCQILVAFVSDGARTLASRIASTGDVLPSVSRRERFNARPARNETSDPRDPRRRHPGCASRASRRSNFTSSRVTPPLTRAFFLFLRSAAAAASLAVVASAGIVAVHPNGASLVAMPVRLGQAAAEAAPAVSTSTAAV